MIEQRRLAAILVANVVGYSKLVGSDEAGTLAKLSALRHDVIEPTISKYSGRLFKAVGDGVLVEFASAVDALSAALGVLCFLPTIIRAFCSACSSRLFALVAR